MTDTRWERVKAIVDRALERAPHERERILDDACGSDPSLRREVESLLGYEDGSFLEHRTSPAVLEDPVALAVAGQQLLHYRILDEVGRGGMGIVYRALDTRLNRQVALKLLPPSLTSDSDRKRRLIREARAAAALNHPNIAVIHAIEEVGESSFIAMELIEGDKLSGLLDRGPLPLSRAVEIATDVASGLGKAHAHGVIHRDLKPANIIVGSDGRVKIIDFGLAKLVDASRSSDRGAGTTRPGTGEGQLLGTAPYMSPEQAGGKTVDARSDVFSFGVLLYEMTTGWRPFRGDGAQAVVSSILNDTPPLVSEVDARVPMSLARLVDRCLRKDAAERFPNGQAVHEALLALDDLSPAPAGSREPRRVLVGRDRELGELQRGVDRILKGQGHFHLISGEPGIGKTRLSEELLLGARDRGLKTVAGHCYEEGAGPLAPFVEILTQLAGQVAPATFKEALGDVASEVARLVPAVSLLFPDLPEPVERPPELKQRYFFDGLLHFWRRLTEDEPYVVLLEDLHWADASSVSLLRHLATHLTGIPPLRLFVVGTYRDVTLEMGEPFKKALADLVRARSSQRLSLRRLPLESVSDFLAMLGGPNPPDPLVRSVFQQTEGNPFFVEEVFQHLSEDGQLFDEDGAWKTDIRIEELNVPEGVRLVIGRRLERLSSEVPTILGVAAVVGRRFEIRVLEALRSLESDTLLKSLEEAEAARLIREVPQHREATYSFTHELTRQTLLSTLSLPRRRRLHLEVADALEAVHRGRLETWAAEIAHHLFAAGSAAEHGRTIHYLELAGDSAQAAASSEEALRSFERALSLLEEGDSGKSRADLLRKRGLALRGLGRWDGMERDLESALSLYEQGQHREGAARICRDLAYHLTWTARAEEARRVAERGLQYVGEVDSTSRCRLLSAAGLAHSIVGEVVSSVRLSTEAAALARKLGDSRLLAEILRDHVLVEFQRLQAGRIVEEGVRATHLQRSINALWELSNTLGVLMIGHMLRGEIEASERVAREARSLAHRQADVGLQVHLLNRKALHDQARGDLAACSDSWQSVVQLLREHGYPLSLHLGMMGLSLSRQGRWDEATTVFEESARIDDEWAVWAGTKAGCRTLSEAYRGGPDAGSLLEAGRAHQPRAGVSNPVGSWHWLIASVEALAYLGERERAGALYPLTLDLLATSARLSFGLGLLERTAAIAAAAAGKWQEAEAHFGSAERQAETIPHVLEQAEVRRWKAWMHLGRGAPGDVDVARRLLQDCLRRYRELGMPLHLEIVAALVR